MNQLDLPPRRTLPQDTRARLRRAVTAGTAEPPVRRLRAPLAVAAGVAVLAAGAIVVAQSVQDTPADYRPGLVPPTTSATSPPPGPELAEAEIAAVLDRCAAAVPEYGPRADWRPAMGINERGISVVGARIGNKQLICQATEWGVTVTDPNAEPHFAEGSGTALLLKTPEGVVAGIADPTWAAVGVDQRGASIGQSSVAHTRGGFFALVNEPAWGMRDARLYEVVDDNANPPSWDQALVAGTPPAPTFVVDRPGTPEAGDQRMLDRCLDTAQESQTQYGWAPAAGTPWRGGRLLLARVGDMVGLCAFEPKPVDGKKYVFGEVTAKWRPNTVCAIPRLTPAGTGPELVGATVPDGAAYAEVTYASGFAQRVPVVKGTIMAPTPQGETLDSIALFDDDTEKIHQGVPEDC